MPTFDTPEPITARIETAAGHVRLSATDRDDTVVEVRPCNESRAVDVRAAERTRIDFAHGTLTVSAGRWGPFGARTGAVEITVELPSRSRLDVSVASAQVRADGEYADCRLASASGDLAVDTSEAQGGAHLGDRGRRDNGNGAVHGLGRRLDRRIERRPHVPGRQRPADRRAATRNPEDADGVGIRCRRNRGSWRDLRAYRQRRSRSRSRTGYRRSPGHHHRVRRRHQ